MRIAAVASSGFLTARFADASAYLFAATALSQTGTYPLRTDRDYFRPPGYAAFLAAVTLGHPERIDVAKSANAILGALAPLLLAAIACRLFCSRAAAVTAGVLASIDPSLVLVSSDVQTEPLFLALLLTAAWFLLVCVDRPSSNFGVLAGVALGLCALTRPSVLAVVPLLLAPLGDRRYPVRVRAHLAASALLGFVVSVAPWTLRNAVVYREFIPISDVGGFNFYLGNSVLTERFFEIRTKEGYGAWAAEADRLIARRMEELRSAGARSPAAVNRALLRQTIAERFAAPAATVRLLWLKARDWLRPYPNPLFWPRSVVLGVGLFYSALYLFAALGLATAPRRGASLFALAFLFVTMAAHVATFVAWRYRVPYWDPVLLLYAGFGAWRGR